MVGSNEAVAVISYAVRGPTDLEQLQRLFVAAWAARVLAKHGSRRAARLLTGERTTVYA